MKRRIHALAALFTLLAIIFITLDIFMDNSLLFSAAITFSTISFHFLMRLFIGWAVNRFAPENINPDCFLLRERHFEQKLYDFIGVKGFKKKALTYNPDSFDIKKTGLEQVLRNMCISEIGHILIIICTYLSVLFCFITDGWNDDIYIFLSTAFLAGLSDLKYVLIQRYNIPRLSRLIKKRAYIKTKAPQ